MCLIGILLTTYFYCGYVYEVSQMMNDFYKPEQPKHGEFDHISFVVPNSHACENVTESLLVLVTSTPMDFRKRNVIRNTWGSMKRYRDVDIKYLFVVGQLSSPIYRTLMLQDEITKYHDIIEIRLKENYKNSFSKKAMFMLYWSMKYCPQAKYIMKTDSDSFNNISGFVDFLLDTYLPKVFIAGMFAYVEPKRTNSEWEVDIINFPYSYYPYYAKGPTYVISTEAVKKILQVSGFVRYFPIEDIYITGLCRLAVNIPAVNIQGILVPVRKAVSCHVTKVLNVNQLSERTMADLWYFIKNRISICKRDSTSKIIDM